MDISKFQRMVVKLGTSSLTEGTPYLSPPRMVDLVRQMSAAQNNGMEVILVSSGAIAAGREALEFPQLPRQIPAKQMLAAVGQPRLMNLYSQLFGLYGHVVAQVLLSRADLNNRRSYLNARNTLLALLRQRVIPIVNENDTTATEEIRVGDNDNLSAQVANLIEANLLVILTDQAGLYTADPRTEPQAELIREVRSQNIPETIWKAAGGTTTGLGTGGMVTKLQAADLARRSGATVVVARGGEANIIEEILRGNPAGTWFYPTENTLESRKRYLLVAGRKTSGSVKIDDGAVRAIRGGGSLLPVGVVGYAGNFDRGDSILVTDMPGNEIARGITNYSHEQLERITGLHSSQIEDILGYSYGDYVVHRDDMIIL